MNYFRLLVVFSFYISLLVIGTGFTFAAELKLESNKRTVDITDEFLVTATISTIESVNAIEGTISFPRDILEIEAIRDGNSSIALWIERPHQNKDGTIVFAGVSPGGINTTESALFSIVFKTKRAGEARIAIEDASLLHNDGLGTEASTTYVDAFVNVTSSVGRGERETVSDATPPEAFAPVLARDDIALDGNWFISFTTQDKTTGISHFEVKEYHFEFLKLFSPWRKVESPYVIRDQKLRSTIIVRAVDNAGNEREAIITPTHSLSWREYLPIVSIPLGAVVMLWYALHRIWKRK